MAEMAEAAGWQDGRQMGWMAHALFAALECFGWAHEVITNVTLTTHPRRTPGHVGCTVSSKSAVSCIVVTRMLTKLPHNASNMLF